MQSQLRHMMTGCVGAVATTMVVLATPSVAAETPFQYRAYTLGSSVAAVAAITATPDGMIRTLHTRPAILRELEWRPPYVLSGEALDPVRNIVFRFLDDRLYEIVVNYERARMEGLTNDDVIEMISATYGQPLLRSQSLTPGARSTDMPADMTVVSEWEDAAALLSLRRGVFAVQFQLVLTAKAEGLLARAAIKEAVRLDLVEGPQRLMEQQKKELAAGIAASDKARAVNKKAFRP